jgi:hypothetical protein
VNKPDMRLKPNGVVAADTLLIGHRPEFTQTVTVTQTTTEVKPPQTILAAAAASDLRSSSQADIAEAAWAG